MAGPFDQTTNLLAPIGDSDHPEGPFGPPVRKPEHIDPVPDVRTMLSKRRDVIHAIKSPAAQGVEVLIRSMNARERSEWVATITTVVDDEGKVGNLLELNKMVAARCVYLTSGEPMFADEHDPLLDEIEGTVFDELVTVCQEVCGLATGGQEISTEEEIAVKG